MMGTDWPAGCCGGCSGETASDAVALPVAANALPDGDYLDLIDRLAELAHEQWSGWIEYLFENAPQNPDGTLTIPEGIVKHWLRQSTTTFEDLPAQEQLANARIGLLMADVFFAWARENKPTE